MASALEAFTQLMKNNQGALNFGSRAAHPSCMMLAGILYEGMYSQNLVGAHVEMRSLQVMLLLLYESLTTVNI